MSDSAVRASLRKKIQGEFSRILGIRSLSSAFNLILFVNKYSQLRTSFDPLAFPLKG